MVTENRCDPDIYAILHGDISKASLRDGGRWSIVECRYRTDIPSTLNALNSHAAPGALEEISHEENRQAAT